MPDSDLIQRLGHWASALPGMPVAIDRLAADGYLDDPRFLQECVTDIDGADVAVIDWIAVQQLQEQLGDDGLAEAMQGASASLDHARRWSVADFPPDARA